MPRQAKEQFSALSAREREVIAWTAQGKTAWQIGKILGIAKRTVDHHVQRAEHKLSANNKTHAVALAIHYGIIEI
jgi:DNA-binding CsgD family transcriptional regulator